MNNKILRHWNTQFKYLFYEIKYDMMWNKNCRLVIMIDHWYYDSCYKTHGSWLQLCDKYRRGKYACFTSIIHVKQNKTTVLHGGRLLPTSSDITAIQKCCIWHQKLLIRYWTIIGKPHSKDWAIIFNACLITKNLQGTYWISSSPLLTLAEHIHVLNQ